MDNSTFIRDKLALITNSKERQGIKVDEISKILTDIINCRVHQFSI